MIKVYGSPRSSSGRVFLLLEEIGLKYETMPIDMMEKREHKSEAFLKLNPNGKVPVLVDGDFTIWESIAINNYLADKYKPELLGKDSRERGLVQQWSVWSMVELQPPLIDIFIQMVFVPTEKRDMALVHKSREKIPPMLSILDRQLEGKQSLVGEGLTVADFNLATVVNLAGALEFDLKPFANLNRWMAELKERPSFKKFFEIRAK